MKNIIVLVVVLSLVFSCSKEKNGSNNKDFLSTLDTLKVDLLKLPIEPESQDIGDKIIEKYKENNTPIMVDIDSLLIKYPDSYSLKAMKVAILTNQGMDSLKKFTDKLIKNNPNDIQAKYFHNLTYADSNSVKEFTKMINKYPDNFLGYFGLAQTIMFTKRDQMDKVVKLAYLSAMKNPSTDDPFLLLEHLFKLKKDEDKKAFINGVMLRRDPSSKSNFRKLFFYYLTKDNKEKAGYLVDTFYKNNPDKMENMELAYLYTIVNDGEKALKYFNLGEKDEKNPEFLSIKAGVLVLNDKYKESVETLRKFKKVTNINNIDFFVDLIYAENMYKFKPYLKLLKEIGGGKATIGSNIKNLLKGKDFNGKEINFDKYLGSVTLVPFWSSTDKRSLNLVKNYEKLLKKYENKKLKILGVDLEKSRKDGEIFYKNGGSSWENIFVEGMFQSPFVQKFAVSSLPSVLVVDKKGVVRYFNLQSYELNRKIDELLSE
ncbi:MAG: hypothetical protein CR982_10695 [Candidatus Cloacimonadota bacterium]|nr:MAG: hypothetical protein CR982_10695 [Candidatus Cloacimonadota bacterium]